MADPIDADLVKRISKAEWTRDLDVIKEYYSPETTLLERQSELDGESVIEIVRNHTDTFELVDYEFDEVLTADNTAAVFATTTYRLPEEQLGGIDFVDETYTTRVATYYEFTDGKLARVRKIENREDMLSAMGVITDDVTGGAVTSDLVGDKIRLEYREVLARLLRHNIRNKTSVITAIADQLLADEATAALGRRLKNASADLADAANKAREIDEQVIGREPSPASVAVREVVKKVVDQQAQRDEATVRLAADDDHELVTDRLVLAAALDELVENAIEHSDESPEVTVAIDPSDRVGYDVQVTITDDGPGIPEQELGPIRTEQETDLEHASSIGLWKVKWCIDRLEGDLQFEMPQGGGTKVQLQLSALESEPN